MSSRGLPLQEDRRLFRDRMLPRRDTSAARRILGGYALLATVATALTLTLRDGSPWSHPAPWLTLAPPIGVVLSASLGVAFASALVLATRLAVARFDWARRLHDDLRPVARGLSFTDVLLIAGLSSLGEELLFRALLVPAIGVGLSAALFGLAHQIAGPSRWVWIAWATSVGLVLGAIFALTGSLVGALVAHAMVNAVNLTFLRDDPPA